MSAPISDSETERTEEAMSLLALIYEVDYPKLTSWELHTVQELRQGKAATRIRLRELRELVKRLRNG